MALCYAVRGDALRRKEEWRFAVRGNGKGNGSMLALSSKRREMALCSKGTGMATAS